MWWGRRNDDPDFERKCKIVSASGLSLGFLGHALNPFLLFLTIVALPSFVMFANTFIEVSLQMVKEGITEQVLSEEFADKFLKHAEQQRPEADREELLQSLQVLREKLAQGELGLVEVLNTLGEHERKQAGKNETNATENAS